MISAEDLDFTDTEAGNLDLLKTKLTSEIDLLLKATYQYICCGILNTERTEASRQQKFEFFDLFPDVEEQLPFVADSLIKAMFFVFAVTSMTSVMFLYIRSQEIRMLKAFDIGLLHTLMQGGCIALAIFIYRRYKKCG